MSEFILILSSITVLVLVPAVWALWVVGTLMKAKEEEEEFRDDNWNCADE